MELIINEQHLRRVVVDGMLAARSSLDLMTADLKAMLVPEGASRRAPSVIAHLRRLAERGVEVRVLHAGVPSAAALDELRAGLPAGLTFRRCPRVHAKLVIVDARAMYVGSANLTGAGLGAKSAGRRNFEMGFWTTGVGFVDAALEQFNALWEGECCQTCQRRDVCPEPLEEPHVAPRRAG